VLAVVLAVADFPMLNVEATLGDDEMGSGILKSNLPTSLPDESKLYAKIASQHRLCKFEVQDFRHPNTQTLCFYGEDLPVWLR